jgi:hypothetical protein
MIAESFQIDRKWSEIPGRDRINTENPRVTGSIPVLGTLYFQGVSVNPRHLLFPELSSFCIVGALVERSELIFRAIVDKLCCFLQC